MIFSGATSKNSVFFGKSFMKYNFQVLEKKWPHFAYEASRGKQNK